MRVSKADRAQLQEHPVSARRIFALFAPHRAVMTIVLSLIVLSALLTLIPPFLTRELIDSAIPRHDVSRLLWLTGGIVAVTIATQTIGVIQTWLATRVGQRIMHALRTDLFAHLQRQPLAFFTRTRTGELQSRLTNDIQGMQSVVTDSATSVASNVTTAVGTAVAMVALSWRLSLISLVVLPPAIWLTRRVARARRLLQSRAQATLADMQTQIEESLSISGIILAKSMAAGAPLTERFRASSRELTDLEVASQMAGRWRMGTMAVIFATIPAAIYLAAGLPATGAGMTIGTLVAFSGLQAALFRPLMGVLNVGIQLTTSKALFSRVFEYLDLPVTITDPEDPAHLPTSGARGQLELRDVSFRYDEADRLAVDDVSFVAEPGQHVAIVGETGSGKSTLAALMARLQDPSDGSVRLDGVDLRDLPLEEVARQIGIVSQETYLLHASVADNLRYAKPEAIDAELIAATRAAQIHDFIAGLPEGYDTIVGARGYRFSGGEKQRLALARVLLRQPRVIILDEATSALDNATEKAVQAAIDDVVGRTTVISIAHRLSTVRDADSIVVLASGRVVEQGSYLELMERDGAFRRLAQAHATPERASSY